MRLTNKVTIITGASSGMGRSIAYLFAKEGAKIVVAADKNIAGGEETVATIRKDGGTAEFIKSDVTIASDAENLANFTQNKFSKIDILINCAGILIPPTEIEKVEEESWERLYDVNVKGTFLIIKYVVPEMKRWGGAIINIGSSLGVKPVKYTAPYSSTKGAIITLTKALALELAQYKIRVNCINPTAVGTPMMEALSKELKDAIISTIPIGHWAKPEDVAYAALYLASDESSMLTGTCINVDGGQGI